MVLPPPDAPFPAALLVTPVVSSVLVDNQPPPPPPIASIAAVPILDLPPFDPLPLELPAPPAPITMF